MAVLLMIAELQNVELAVVRPDACAIDWNPTLVQRGRTFGVALRIGPKSK